MADYASYRQQNHKPSTYSATITTDQIIISRHEYNELVENKYRLGQANETLSGLKGEIAMLKDVLQRIMGFYGTSGNNATNITSTGMIDDSTAVNQKEEVNGGGKATKLIIRRDSGVEGVDTYEKDQESDSRSSNRVAARETIKTLHVKRKEAASLLLSKRLAQNELNLLDLEEDNEVPVHVKQKNTLRNGIHDSTDEQTEKKPQTYSRIAARRPLESPVAPLPSPTPGPSRVARRVYSEPEPEALPRPQLGYESPEEEEERPPTSASWEQAPAAPEVTFDDFNADDDEWKKSAEWDPSPGKGKGIEKVPAAVSSRPGPTLIQAVKPNLRPIYSPSTRDKMEDSSPSPPTPVTSSGPKTARQLYLEKQKLLRALSETRAKPLETSSVASSSGDMDKLVANPDPSTFRHIYIPNLPGDATLSTLTSVIRTNGQGGLEFISLFRQKAESVDFPNYEDPGSGENIGVNITFTTAEACDAWFKFLFENSSQKLQGNPTKTWLFPSEESAAEWKKCAVFRRSDYHPSIAGKIDKGGPGGQAALAEAQKKGATRVLLVTGLPPDVTETELAWLALPPGNRSLQYDGPTHLASGQAGLSTEEFARWKWLEKIVIEDEEPIGFGDGLERSKRAKIYAAGIKTAYLARGKIWKKYNRNGAVVGKGSGSYVKVEFVKDECEGPLEELPPWVVVGGDDDDLDFGDGEGRDMDE